MIHVVLFEPEIPANTGNVGRTCVATNTRLHLIGPLGFHLSEKHLKRAGMDYWDQLDVVVYVNYQDFLDKNPGADIFVVETFATQNYTAVTYTENCYLMFGKESTGVPKEIVTEHAEKAVRIPMLEGTRSLNLGNSVSLVLYEVLRQLDFPGLT